MEVVRGRPNDVLPSLTVPVGGVPKIRHLADAKQNVTGGKTNRVIVSCLVGDTCRVVKLCSGRQDGCKRAESTGFQQGNG